MAELLSDLALSLVRFILSPLPESLRDEVVRLGLRDQIFLGATAIVVLLFAVSLLLAIGALTYRAHRERRARKQAAFQSLLRPHLLRVLSCQAAVSDIRHLVPHGREMEFLEILLEYADKVKGAERVLVHEMAKPHLAAAERRIAAMTPERRALAVRALGVLGLPESAPALLRSLDDPSPEVALVAAHALAERGGSEYARPILTHLHRFERWSPWYLAEMLASMGGTIVPALTEITLDVQYPAGVRAIAADAMRLIGYPEAADTAARILEQGEEGRWRGERETRIAALKILALLGRAEHLPLVRNLARDPDPAIREVSVAALGALGTREDLPLLVDELNGPSRWVALEAARAIRALREVGEADGEIQVNHDRVPLFWEVLAE